MISTGLRSMLGTVLLLLGLVLEPARAQFITTLYNFPGNADGANPSASLIQARDGNFYGTTSESGTDGNGTIYKITPNGVLTTLYRFTGGVDGGKPYAGLMQAGDGNLYGTTQVGGTDGNGTIFTITTGGTFTPLYSFSALSYNGSLWTNPDGANPSAGLVQASDGNLYGTTQSGGANGDGTIYKITTGGTFTLFYSFTGGADGANPRAALIQARDGLLYGTAQNGGNNGYGTIFKITTHGILTTLRSLHFADGPNPVTSLVQAGDGKFYGTSSSSVFFSTVYMISPAGTFKLLYKFNRSLDGSDPQAGLVQASDGNLYGTTQYAGVNGNGTVYKITTGGTFTLLYSFTNGADGAHPLAGLIVANDGSLYGTACNGGNNGNGSVYKITTGGALTPLYSFSGIGINPSAGLIQASDGNFYGTTQNSGAKGTGTVFQLTPDGSITTLHNFSAVNSGVNTDGANPFAGLIQASDGNLYGTTYDGGTNGYGTIFKITTDGTFTLLYSFTGSADGANPSAGLVQAGDGNLYGTTYNGGDNGYGTVYKITIDGTLTSLYSFTHGVDGAHPYAALIQASDGNLYGTASQGGSDKLGPSKGNGTVFRITTGGTFTPLYSFKGLVNGSDPLAGLVQAGDGNLYGTASQGGPGNTGTVYKITTDGTFTLLYTFKGGGDTANPIGGLVQASDGNLYGTTYGTWANVGTVYKITPDGKYTSLYIFTIGVDGGGGHPYAALMQARDGYLYGTTYSNSTAFRIDTVALNPVPSLSRISPSDIDAGGPDITLTLTGNNFISHSTVYGGKNALATSFVSATQLTATVPAGLIAQAGSLKITVVNPMPIGGTSSAKSLMLLQTSLNFSLNSLVKNSDGSFTASVSLANAGYLEANSLTITSSKLGAAATSTSLPASLGDVGAGASANASLTYPASAGHSGHTVTLRVFSKFTGGSSSNTLQVTLP